MQTHKLRLKKWALCTMYSARRSTQSFVPEQNYTVCIFCLADDGDVHGVHHDNEKNQPILGSNILKYKYTVGNHTKHHAVFVFLV